LELCQEDADAMMALLRYLYGIPYPLIDPEADDFHHFDEPCGSCLQDHALVLVVAEKYQITTLHMDTYKNMAKTIGLPNCSFDNFTVTLRTILTSTSKDSLTRVIMMDACFAGLQEFRERKDFISLLVALPDLGIEIIKNADFKIEPLGKWVYEEEMECGDTSKPGCRECRRAYGSIIPFEDAFSRNIEERLNGNALSVRT
jgi:hypothetical protein